MAQVILHDNESIESALRRFKRQVSQAGIFADMKKKIISQVVSNNSYKHKEAILLALESNEIKEVDMNHGKL